MPRGKKDLKSMSHIEKLRWAENQMIVMTNTIKETFEETGSLSAARAATQTIRAMMQAIRDQIRYHSVKKAAEEVEEEDVV